MADAVELAQATTVDGVTRWGLVLNRRGAERALEAGLANLQLVISVSDAHGTRNAGRTVTEALADLVQIVTRASAAGASVEVTLATAFGCPYDGPVALDQVVDLARAVAAAGACGIGLADTIGVATPQEVAAGVAAVLDATGLPIGAHLHDTRGMALANALAALDAGAVRLDCALGSLGGCPFAPGATGNLAIEDLAHALDAMGVSTGLSVDGLIAAADLVCSLVGRPVASHVGQAGPRFSPSPT
jgi:hydroxymethylglutaryl-CoA lyase